MIRDDIYSDKYPVYPDDPCGVDFFALGEAPITEDDSGWVCTRSPGHDGPHVAHGARGNIYAIEGVTRDGVTEFLSA